MKFNFISENESEEINNIIDCLQNILAIPEGSIPLNRGLGLKWSSLSTVPEDLENDYATDLMEKVEKWEPRIEVVAVEFGYGEDGQATVNVQIELTETEDNEEEDEEE
jgi:phage baseplate assembly protein W